MVIVGRSWACSILWSATASHLGDCRWSTWEDVEQSTPACWCTLKTKIPEEEWWFSDHQTLLADQNLEVVETAWREVGMTNFSCCKYGQTLEGEPQECSHIEIACDGAWKMLSAKRLAKTYKRYPEPGWKLVHRLASMCWRRWRGKNPMRGGYFRIPGINSQTLGRTEGQDGNQYSSPSIETDTKESSTKVSNTKVGVSTNKALSLYLIYREDQETS
jgi:hypothetical protein